MVFSGSVHPCSFSRPCSCHGLCSRDSLRLGWLFIFIHVRRYITSSATPTPVTTTTISCAGGSGTGRDVGQKNGRDITGTETPSVVALAYRRAANSNHFEIHLCYTYLNWLLSAISLGMLFSRFQCPCFRWYLDHWCGFAPIY